MAASTSSTDADDYLSDAVTAFERRHGNKPDGVVVGLEAGVVLARSGALWPRAGGVCVVSRPLQASDHPVEPGEGRRLFVGLSRSDGIVRMRVCELALAAAR